MKRLMLGALILTASIAIAGLAVAQGRGGFGPAATGDMPGPPDAGMRPGGPGGPGGPGPGGLRGPDMMVEPTEQGVFVLQGGVLLKYDAATLKQVGRIVLLQPRDAESGDQPGPPHMGPPAGTLRVHEGNVLAVLADQFVVVNAASFKVTAKATIPAPARQDAPPEDVNADAGFRRPPMAPQCMMLKTVGETAYLQRGPELLAVSIANGKVTATGELPLPARPENPPR